jgi:hypothetical protein
MSSTDYCWWRGERCKYESEYWHCPFHRAWTELDNYDRHAGMIEAIEALDLPAGVRVCRIEPRPEGGYFITLEALPDRRSDGH